MAATWKNNPDLMSRLRAAQNHPANINGDVMTFAGFCDSRHELEAHVESCEINALSHDLVAVALGNVGRKAKRRGA